MTRYEKGSITIYLSLILMLMISLVSAGLESVRTAAARTQIANSVDIGLYSLFAEYDRELLSRYDIFALDASGGDGLLDLASIYGEYERYMKPVLRQNSQKLFVLEGGMDGYRLLTDEEGEVFFRQVVAYMEETLGAHMIMAAQERIRERQIHTASAEEAGREAESRRTFTDYQEELDEAARKSQEEENRLREEAAAAIPDPVGGNIDFAGEDTGNIRFDSGEAAQAEPVVNPIPFIRQVRQMGLLGLVLPPDRPLSGVTMNDDFFLSRRLMQTGMGMEDWYEQGFSLAGDALFQQYCVEKLGNYLKPSATGMNYQLEYVIGGKQTDRDNLEKVATRLLLIREGVNAACLTADPEKMQEVSTLAAGIAAGFLIPPAAGAIEAALILCWSFGESILDLRELFAGGRVPLVKRPDQWQLALGNLTTILDRLDTDRRNDPEGISYEDYLQVLLLPVSRGHKTMCAMDMIEQTLRTMEGWGNFRLDSCVVAVSVYAGISVNVRRLLQVQKSYGYA